MEILTFLGWLVILMFIFMLGIFVGAWIRQTAIENDGYKIIYTPNADRKYMIIDTWQDMNNVPSHDPYKNLFKR